MQKRNCETLIVAMLLLFAVMLPDAVIGDTLAGNPAIEKKSGDVINVTVDPRIELLSVVQYLSEYKGYLGMQLLTSRSFSYVNDAIIHFRPYKEHQAVTLFKEMSANGFWYSQPLHSMLYLSSPPELQVLSSVDDFNIERAGGIDKLDEFFEQLRQFAVDSNFMEYYNTQLEAQEKIIEKYRENITRDYVADLENYYGKGQNSYNIVLSPFYHNSGFGPKIEVTEGIYDVYNIIGTSGVSDDVPTFGTVENTQRIVWHEFGHSFINYLTDNNLELFMEPADILKATMKARFEPSEWETYVHEWASESILRAVTTRLAYREFGETAGDNALNKEVNAGYDHVGALCETLKLYEDGRDTYATFESFYPELADTFRERAGLEPVGVDVAAPAQFSLNGNYPNPFNMSTAIDFTLNDTGVVTIALYSVTGQKVRELVNGTMSPGPHTVVWDGRDDNGNDVSSSVYCVSMRMGERTAYHRMTLVK